MATLLFELMADPLLSAEKEPESKEESPLASPTSLSESENETNLSSIPPDVCIKCKKRPISYKKAHLCKSCYTNLPKYLERKKKYYNSDKARTKRRLQSAMETSHMVASEDSNSPRFGVRRHRAHMKVEMTLDNGPQRFTNGHPSTTTFHDPLSPQSFENSDRQHNTLLSPPNGTPQAPPSISPYQDQRASESQYIGHAMQTYAQTIGVPREYGMHYGMFRSPSNAIPFDPLVVYKFDSSQAHPMYYSSPNHVPTPFIMPQNPAQYPAWQQTKIEPIQPSISQPNNSTEQRQPNGTIGFHSPLFTEQCRARLVTDGFFVADLLNPAEIDLCNEELDKIGTNDVDPISKLWTGCWNAKAQFYIRTHPKLYSLLASCYGNATLVSYPEFSIRLPNEIKSENSAHFFYAQTGIDYKQQFYRIAQGQSVDRRFVAVVALSDQDGFGFNLLPGSQRPEFWVNWVRANAEELDRDSQGGCIRLTESRYKESALLKTKFVPLPLKAGQVVIFDSFMAYGFTSAADVKSRNFVLVNLVESVDDKRNTADLKNCELFISNMSRIPPAVTLQHRGHSSEISNRLSSAEKICLTYLGHALLGDTRLYSAAEGKRILERLQSPEHWESEIDQLSRAVLDEWRRSREEDQNTVNYNNNDVLPRRISIQNILNL